MKDEETQALAALLNPRRQLVDMLTARRVDPVIRNHYEHLTGAGKPYKVAMTACMRKLLVILNAMMRDQTPWSLDSGHTTA